MTGRVHLVTAAVGGVAVAEAGWHLDLRPALLVLVTVFGGLFPDVDRSTSLLGRWIPQAVFPTVVLSTEPYRTGRRVRGTPFVVEHHGLTHSVPFNALLCCGVWLLFGAVWAEMLALGIAIHLLLDGGSYVKLWWPSRRWVRLWPGWLG